MTVDFTKRINAGQPVKEEDIETAIDNSEELLANTVFSGARVFGSLSIPTATLTSVTYSSTSYDTDTYFSGGSPTRLTIPAGIKYMEIYAQISGPIVMRDFTADFRINGSSFDGQGQYSVDYAKTRSVRSARISVVATDYLEMRISHANGSNQTVSYNVEIKGFR